MDNLQSRSQEQAARFRKFAFVFMVSGGILVAVVIYKLFDTATRHWNSVGYIQSVDNAADWKAFKAAQPKLDEWPLAVAQERLVSGTHSNRYTVEVTPVRGTSLLRIDVIGRSPERTAALGRWLTGLFAHDFSNSLANHGVAQPYHPGSDSLIVETPGLAVPLRLHPGTLLLSLLAPVLLVLSGIVLNHAARVGYPEA